MSSVPRTAATIVGVAVPGVLVAVTAFVAPLPSGSGARGPEQIRLPAADTVSVCPGPLVVDAEAEGTDEEFSTEGAPEARARAVTVETGAPGGSRQAAAIRAGSLDGEVRFETPAESPFVTGDDVVDAPSLYTGLAANESPALTSAAQTTSADSGDLAGLAAHSCDRPLTRAVFSGATTMTGDDTRILLGNPTDAPVSVQIVLTGESGPVPVSGQDTFTVDPHSTRDVSLGALAAGVPVLGAEVTAEDGQVTAVLQHIRRDGLDPRGIEYAAAESRPDESFAVPIATSGETRLRVTNPNDTAASAILSAHTAEGPADLGVRSVSVPARGTAEVDLGEVTPGDVVLEADRPLSAQATVSVDTETGADLAHYPATAELGDTQLVVLPEETEGDLVVSAGTGMIEVTAIDGDGERGDPRTVDLDPERAVVLGLDDFPEARALELSNPGGAEAFAAVGVRADTGASGVGVPAPPTGVDYQDVRLER